MRWLIENLLADRLAVSWFALDEVAVREQLPELEAQIAERARDLRARYPDPASAAPLFAGARRLYHDVGLDPSKHRPSSEALVRRILQGKGLFQVNTAVDAANLASISHHRPVGLYDAERIVAREEVDAVAGTERAMVTLRAGRAGEEYPGIGKEMIHLEGRPALFDEIGPFGNPSSDSDRTKVTIASRTLLFVLFEPIGESDEARASHLALSREIMLRAVGGRVP